MTSVRTPMMTKTKVAMVAGFLIFAAGGAGAAYMASRDSGASTKTSGVADVEVLYAVGPIDSGTPGATAVADGRLRTKRIAPDKLPVDAATNPTQVAGRVAAQSIAPGTVVTTAMFPAPQTRIGTVVIPPGMRALSLELESVPGISGFAGAGDRIDVYRVAKGGATPPLVQLVLQGVEVLNVNGGGLPTTQGVPSAPNLIYLVAVTPADAERLIYLSEFEAMYFDLVPKGAPTVETPGAGPGPGLRAT